MPVPSHGLDIQRHISLTFLQSESEDERQLFVLLLLWELLTFSFDNCICIVLMAKSKCDRKKERYFLFNVNNVNKI